MAVDTNTFKRVSAITLHHEQVGSGGATIGTTITRESFIDGASDVKEPFDPSDSNAAQTDGGDVRFALNQDGTGQLAIDVISFEHDSTSGAQDAKIQINVGPISRSSVSDDTIYMFWSTSGTTSQPAAGDTYGAYNAYDSGTQDFWPLEGDPSSTLASRTSNQQGMTSIGSMSGGDSVTGKVGNAVQLDGNNDALKAAYSHADRQTVQVAMWVNFNTFGGYNWGNALVGWRGPEAGNESEWAYNKHGDGHAESTESYTISVRDSGGDEQNFSRVGSAHTFNDDLSTNIWYHVVFSFDNSNKEFKVYRDGALVSTGAINASIDDLDTSTMWVGTDEADGQGEGDWLDGLVDEIQVHTTIRDEAWWSTYYNNTNAPASFATAGTPEDAGGGGAVAIPWPVLQMQMIGSG